MKIRYIYSTIDRTTWSDNKTMMTTQGAKSSSVWYWPRLVCYKLPGIGQAPSPLNMNAPPPPPKKNESFIVRIDNDTDQWLFNEKICIQMYQSLFGHNFVKYHLSMQKILHSSWLQVNINHIILARDLFGQASDGDKGIWKWMDHYS